MGLSSSIIQQFKISFEIRCIQLIVDAYGATLQEKTVEIDLDENDITAILHEHIKVNPNRAKWQIVSNVEEHISDSKIEKKKGFSSKLSRIDLRFATFNSNLEYTYHIEAKRLKEKDSQLKRRYINTGIDSFVNKKYQNGCLAGYLLEGTIPRTVDGVNSLLQKDGREKEQLVKILNNHHSEYYESKHDGLPCLKHFMFDFQTLN